MANEQNLKPIRSKSEAREIGSRGGKKSGERRKQLKTMREMLDFLMSKEILKKSGEKATTLEAMMSAIVKKAISGDIRAAEFIRDTTGQKPIDKAEITGKDGKDLLPPVDLSGLSDDKLLLLVERVDEKID